MTKVAIRCELLSCRHGLSSLMWLGILGPSLALPPRAVWSDPVSISHRGDPIAAVGDASLPDNGAATDVGEGVANAIDGTNAKYYNRSAYGGNFAGSGFIVTPAAGESIVTGLALTSGNDSPSRDPVDFTLLGSADGRKFEVIVAKAPIPPFTGRNTAQTVTFANTKAYASYEVLFPDINQGHDMQVDEADLLGTPAPGGHALSPAEVAQAAARLGGHGSLVPIADPGPLMPRHGTVSLYPAKEWEDSLAAGNGTTGALLAGDPENDTLIADHCKLWLPLGSREVVPEMGEVLPEMRKIIGESGYGDGQKFFLDQARKQGWSGHLVWTDPFHPGFFVKIHQPQPDGVTNYARVEDFSAGEVWAQWDTPQGHYARRMFVSKPDNVIVLTTTGPAGGVALDLTIPKVDNDGIESHIECNPGFFTGHNVYVHGKGGYDFAVRVVNDGGTQAAAGGMISVSGANSVTLIMRIQPWKTPLADTQAWPYMPANPDFAQANQTAGLYRAAPAYNPDWMSDTVQAVTNLPGNYDALLKPHSAAWSRIFDRVSINLGGDPAQRAMASETLLDLGQHEKTLTPALLERMYDAGRYVFMCSSGPETPPNLFGIWTGTWQPAWSGDYTTDTNLQLDTECAYSANMAEQMDGYFNLWDSYIPDFQRNARALYGCRGILIGSRASNNGLALHWDSGWPGNLWTPGAPWIAHWYYDRYLYTGDKVFLRDRAIPWMEQCALFYEDFLKGSEDASGHYTFRPSYSAENGWGDNTSQDIEICHQLLTNLIQGCQTLGIKGDEVKRWQALLAKLPPLLINDQGQLKEWSNPTQGEQNNHRHLMHLYGAFDGDQFSPESDPKLFDAARVALLNRVKASKEDATHGFMHTGLAAATLGMGDLAWERVAQMAIHRSIYPSMVDAHYGGPRILCDDGNGATPEIVNRMLLQSDPGVLQLLPALPAAIPHGGISGMRARGAILVNQLTWDVTAGTVTATFTADATGAVTVVFPPQAAVKSIVVDEKEQPVKTVGVNKQGCEVALPGGKPVKVTAHFAWTPDPTLRFGV